MNYLKPICSRAWPIAAIIAALCQAGCGSKSAARSASASAAAPRAVQAVKAEVRTFERTVKAVGTLAAQDQATLSTKVPGRLQSVLVDIGEVVQAGQPLSIIEPRDYKLRVQQSEALLAQARVRLGLPLEGTDDTVDLEKTGTVRQTRAVLEEARANRDRSRSLAAQKILSRSEVETAEAAFEVAISKYEEALEDVRNRQALVAQRRAEAEIARKELDDTTIRAPFAGAVQERKANLGEYLSASAPVLTLVRMNPLRLRVDVPERESARVAVDQTVRISLEGSTNVFLGAIKRLSPALDEKSRMLRVEADVPNPGQLRPGSFARVEIVINQSEAAVTIPAKALLTFAGIEKVFAFESGKALERSVTTGRRLGDIVEISSGLKAGDLVILDPGGMQNGQAVQLNVEPSGRTHSNPIPAPNRS